MNTYTTPSRISQSYPRDPQSDIITDIQSMAAHFAARRGQSPTHVRLYATDQESAEIAQGTGLCVLLMGQHYQQVVLERMEE